MSDDPMITEAERYAEKVLVRHVPISPAQNVSICVCCQQRVHDQPVWPCDARKLALLTLQRSRVDDLLRWVQNSRKADEN